ncbi:MAG TPA: hypothetical protein VHT97_01650 [Acidimicrobiales bacterium]|jgi:hypothetical protein|nr:hypothetical protein [Acidimicrobiales bacterium]
MTSSAPKSPALRALYWRSEILQVVYWLYGEGLGDFVDLGLIRQYLGVDAHENLSTYLDLLVGDGSLVAEGDWYALSARALAEGEAQLATAFTDLVHPVGNECDDQCWCQASPAEADACARARTLPRRPVPTTEAGKATA